MIIKEEIKNIVSEFEALHSGQFANVVAAAPAFLKNIYNQSIAKFKSIGLPNRKNENYKYLDIANLFTKNYEKAITPTQVKVDINDIFKCDVPELDTNAIIILNGFYFSPDGNKINILPSGAVVGSLAQAIIDYPELVEKYLNKSAEKSDEGLVALNSAFIQDGVFIYVPKDAKLEKPLQIIHLMMEAKSIMAQHRNLFVFEEGSEGKVVICDHSLSPSEFLTNSVSEIFADEKAKIEVVRMQNEHNSSKQLTNTFIDQQKDSDVIINTLTLHGGTVRNNLFVNLNDEGCQNRAYGLNLTDRNQQVDNYVYINHAKPNCHSTQLYKGVLDDEAKGAFSGRIFVAPDAQKTEAFQNNNTMLLTDDAQMRSKPQLEIYADDVKCSHGSTSGQLDEDALFYMKARGIGDKEARMLLMFAFAHEIISKISVEPLFERVNNLVEKRLRGEMSRCNNCMMACDTNQKNN